MDKKLILLVENDINLCQSILLILQRASYLVEAISSTAEAMEAIKYGNYYMVVADIDEPGTREVFLPGLLGQYPSIPIVVLTEIVVVEKERREARRNVRYLVKPIAPEDLLDCVGSLFSDRNSYGYQNQSGFALKPR